MTLTEKLIETKIRGDKYSAAVQLWRSDVGGHLKIISEYYRLKPYSMFFGLISGVSRQKIDRVEHGMYHDQSSWDDAIDVAQGNVKQYDADYKKFN